MSDDFREVTKKVDVISKQAAIDALGERPLAWTESEYETGLQNQWEADVDAIKAVPPAQPEIIRCKDCKWYGFYSCELHGNDWMRDGNGFCDRAERREE